jgi:hypothetical protein
LPRFCGISFSVLLIAFVVFAGVFAAVPRSGYGAARTEDELLRQGVEARKRREDAAAFELFKEAYAMHHSARAAAQMGLAELALGRWVEAEGHLSESLDAKDDPWIKKSARTLAESLARVRREIGALEVLGSPRGAEVVIEGEVKATLPMKEPIRVRAGDLRFELRAPGHLAETRTVRVTARELTRETVSLSALPPPPSAARAERSAPGVRASAAGPPAIKRIMPAPEREASASPEGRGARIGGIVAGALGVAAVGAGVALGLKARSAGVADSAAPDFSRSHEINGQRYQLLQWVGYGAGAALLTGGLISYLIGASRAKPSATEVGFAPTAGGACATWGGAF